MIRIGWGVTEERCSNNSDQVRMVSLKKGVASTVISGWCVTEERCSKYSDQDRMEFHLGKI